MKRTILAITFLLLVISSNAYSEISVKSSNWLSGLKTIADNFEIKRSKTSEVLNSDDSEVNKSDNIKGKSHKKEITTQPSSSRIGIVLGQACFGKYIKN